MTNTTKTHSIQWPTRDPKMAGIELSLRGLKGREGTSDKDERPTCLLAAPLSVRPTTCVGLAIGCFAWSHHLGVETLPFSEVPVVRVSSLNSCHQTGGLALESVHEDSENCRECIHNPIAASDLQ